MEEKTKIMIDQFINQFPDYKSWSGFDYSDESPYYSLGVFAKFLLEKVKNYEQNIEAIDKTFDLINHIFESKDTTEEMLDVVSIELFETIASSKKAVKVATSKLKGKAWDNFQYVLLNFDQVDD